MSHFVFTKVTAFNDIKSELLVIFLFALRIFTLETQAVRRYNEVIVTYVVHLANTDLQVRHNDVSLTPC